MDSSKKVEFPLLRLKSRARQITCSCLKAPISHSTLRCDAAGDGNKILNHKYVSSVNLSGRRSSWHSILASFAQDQSRHTLCQFLPLPATISTNLRTVDESSCYLYLKGTDHGPYPAEPSSSGTARSLAQLLYHSLWHLLRSLQSISRYICPTKDQLQYRTPCP